MMFLEEKKRKKPVGYMHELNWPFQELSAYFCYWYNVQWNVLCYLVDVYFIVSVPCVMCFAFV